MTNCELCGEPMPPNEQMFKYHGYSGGCPKPPITSRPSPAPVQAEPSEARTRLKRVNGEGTRDYRLYLGMEDDVEKVLNALDQQDAEIARLTHFVGEVRKDRDAAICEIQRLYDIRGEQITELSQLREQLADALKAADAAFAERDRLRAENERLTGATIYLKSRREQADEENAALRAQVEDLQPTVRMVRESAQMIRQFASQTHDESNATQLYALADALAGRIAGSQP